MKTRREGALRMPTPSGHGRMRLAVVLFAGLILAQAPVVLAQAPDWLWAERAGGSDRDLGEAIAVDGSGNVLVAGRFRGTAEFGDVTLTSAGEDDVFVAKVDAQGNMIWAKRAGGSGFDRGRGIAVDAEGNALVTGWFNGTAEFGDVTLTSAGGSDIFVAKVDPQGNVVWAQRAGGSSEDILYTDRGVGIAVDGSGNALVTGDFEGTAEFGDTTLTSVGGSDVFVAKVDAQGNVVWAQRAGSSPGDDTGFAIAVDGSGNALVTGEFLDTAEFGEATLTSTGSYDAFIAKYDAQGNVVWAERAGGSGIDSGEATAVDGSGNALVAGVFRGTAEFGAATLTSAGSFDAFVAKVDAQGNVVWAERAGGSGFDESHAIAVDGAGNALVTGQFERTAEFGAATLASAGSFDAFVAKVDAGGNVAWVRRAGGSGKDFGNAIALDESGNALVTGQAGTAEFGDITLTSAGETDAFVAKLGSNSEREAASRADRRGPPFRDDGYLGDPPTPDQAAGQRLDRGELARRSDARAQASLGDCDQIELRDPVALADVDIGGALRGERIRIESPCKAIAIYSCLRTMTGRPRHLSLP